MTARAGCSNRGEPGYNEMGMAFPGRAGSSADIEAKLPPPHGPTLLDVSHTHPYLHTLSEVAAAQGPAVTKGSCLAGTHHELSVAFIKCQGSVYRGCFNLLARAVGPRSRQGLRSPMKTEAE